MSLFRLPVLATITTLGALTLSLLGGACSSDAPPHEGREGPAGRTQVGLTLATPGFVETTVFGGLNQPTVVRFAGDGRAFVAEKGGKIWVFDNLTDATPTLFADLSVSVHDFWDRGLLGMALDPGFPAKPYVYVLYAYDGDPGGAAPKWGDQCPDPPGATGDGCVISGRLSRFTATGNTGGAEKVLVQGWRQQYPSHSIGQVEFGPDGALYASGGDGASFNFVDYGQDGDPLNPLGDPPVAVGVAQTLPGAEGGALRSQSMRRGDGPALLNGSVIRVDPATGLGLADNPMAASADVNAQRIIAYGLRNPFRIAARPGKSELWVADVGWNDWEELDRIPLGSGQQKNFGWPCYEGAGKQAGYDAANLSLCESLYTGGGHTAPFFTYQHNAGVSASDACGRGSSSVTGIAFYTASAYPAEYQGGLFFSDFSRRCIYVMPQGNGGDPSPADVRSFHVDADGPVFLTTGPGGDLFYAALTSGTIQRISYLQPVAAFKATPTQGQVPLVVNFDASSSTKALPTDVLSYAWDLDGDGDFDDSDDAKPAYLYDSVGNYAARLKVTDQRGVSDASAPLTIKVSAEPPPVTTPPEVFIDTPSADLHWKVGDKIQFSGHATDAEDGVLPASALSWQILIQHCPSGCHIHDLLSFDGVASGSFTAEDHEYPMHLEIILTATDSSGQKRTAQLALEPRTVSLLFDTDPSGLSLVVGSTSQVTPFARRVIVGSENSISAPDPQPYRGATWQFSKWSDALPQTHTLPTAAAAARYVASYVPGGGLTGQYFDELGFAGTSLTRVDPVIDFDWGNDSPDPSLGADTFSVRWTGEVLADFAEIYAFSTTSDDGVRLTVDGKVVIDHFDDHGPTLDTGSLALTAGWHPVVLEYYENGGGAQLHWSWSSPSQPQQIVPDTHLRPGCASGSCASGLSCNASNLCVSECSPTCKGTKHCRASDGACVGLCNGVKCPAGDKCVSSGICVDACSLIACAIGQHCAAGACVMDPPSNGDGGAGGEGGAAGQPGMTGHAGSGGQQGSGGHAGVAGQAGIAGQTGVAGQTGEAGQTGAAGEPSEPGSAGATGSGGAGETDEHGGAPATDEAGAANGGAPTTNEPGAGGMIAIAGSGESPDSGNAAGAAAPTNGADGGAPPASGGSASSGGGNGGTDSGCSCRTAGGSERGFGVELLGGVVALSLLRRRRQRAERVTSAR